MQYIIMHIWYLIPQRMGFITHLSLDAGNTIRAMPASCIGSCIDQWWKPGEVKVLQIIADTTGNTEMQSCHITESLRERNLMYINIRLRENLFVAVKIVETKNWKSNDPFHTIDCLSKTFFYSENWKINWIYIYEIGMGMNFCRNVYILNTLVYTGHHNRQPD